MLTKSSTKVAPNFYCKICDYKTCKKFNWEKHLSTDKHKMLTNANKSSTKVAPKIQLHSCSNCGKSYKQKSSLSRHRKNCVKSDIIEVNKEELEEMQIKAELYEEQKQDINELKELVKQVADYGTTTTINNNVNINIILNTKCKDAMNITDFMNTLKLSLDDLLYTKKNGYIEGVSNIFIKNLQDLDPEQRPIHCSDKRGTSLYIKDDNKWEKDGDGKILDNQINAVTKKHVDVLKAWEEAHPNWKDSEIETKIYMELVQKIMGGSSDEEREKNLKLIQKKIGKNFSITDL
tara:strand:- start:1281 stop:2153 length:873 start_codon:yes stop_codon:yes gene_type:complete